MIALGKIGAMEVSVRERRQDIRIMAVINDADPVGWPRESCCRYSFAP